MSHELMPFYFSVLNAIISGRIIERKGPMDAQDQGLAGDLICAFALPLSAEKP